LSCVTDNVDAAEFWSQVGVGPSDQCWPWLGAISSTGYGTMTIDGRTRGAHRIACELEHGTIPRGHVVMHACDNRQCCNPAHLSTGTHRANALERADRHRGRGQRRGCDGSYIPEGRRYW
jgi:hypothetical protein